MFIRKIVVLGILMLLSTVTSATVSDTISFWHVDYNETTILKLHQGMEGAVLTINKDSLYEDDLLGIKYSAGCFFCNDCVTHIGIYDQNNNLIQHEDALGDFTPIVINFRKILLQNFSQKEEFFDCYYLEGNVLDPNRAVHVLRIQLE